MIFFVVLILCMFAALVLQHFIPALPALPGMSSGLPWFEGVRVLLMPLVMFYGSIALPYAGMLALTFIGGFMWDALNTQVIEVTTEMAPQQAVEISLGWSIVLYAVLGSIMNGLRPLFRRGRWEVYCLLSGVFTSLIVLVEFLMITFRRGTPAFPDVIWERVIGAGAIALLLSPFFYFALSSIAALTGYKNQLERSEA